MTKFEKKTFFMLELESEGWNLPPCKFLARSEVRINEMPFWRFGWFSWYLEKIIKFLRSNSWSTVKITPRNEFWSTNYPVLILTIFENLSFSKNQNDKIWKKMSFFISNSESGCRNLPACKFLARSEVRIVEMTFWRFGWFFGYFPKIIQFLRSDSKSTIKITPRKKIWSI